MNSNRFLLYEVKIWDKELECDFCSNNQWFKGVLKTEFESEENAHRYTEEVRYLFECKECGNCRIFGMMSDENDNVNIAVYPVSEI